MRKHKMMQRLRVLTAVFAVLALLPSTAWAGSAGGSTLPCEATQQLDFVIDDDGDGVRDPGETTLCTNPVVDTTDPANPLVRNGPAGPVCLPAVVAQLRGTLTLIADDDAKDNDIVSVGQNTGQVLTLLIEVRNQDKVFRVADSYAAGPDPPNPPKTLAALNLGNWDNRLTSETKIFGLKFPGALFLTPTLQGGNVVTSGAFDDLGAKLSQIAEDEGLVADATTVLPIIAQPTRDGTRKRFIVSDPTKCGDAVESVPASCGELEVDEGASSVASIAVFRVTISFAEKLSGSPPACS